MENLRQRGIKAFVWDFSGRIAGQTVSFIISIFLARLLSPQDFGLLAMVNVVIAISSSFMDMGLGVALIQRKEVDDRHYGSVFFFNITVGILLCLILFFSSGFLAKFYHREIISHLAKAMSPVFVISSFGNVIRFRLRKTLEFGIPTKASLFSATLSGALGIFLAFRGFGVWSLVIQSILNPIISNAYLFYKVKWRPKLIMHFGALKELWSFGFRMFLLNMLETINANLDAIIIGKIFSPISLGYYYRAKSLNNYIIQYSSGSLMNILFPVLSKLQDDLTRLKDVVTRSFHLLCFITFFLVGLFFLTGEDIIIILFSSKWEPAVKLFRILILGSYASPLSSLLVNILSSQGNSKSFLKLEILKKILLTINFLVGFSFGIVGFLYGLAIFSFIAVFLNMFFAAKQLKEKTIWFTKMIIQYAVLSVLLVIIFFYLFKLLGIYNHYYHLFISGFGFTAAYYFFSLLFKFKGFEIFISEIKKVQLFEKIKIKAKSFLMNSD